ncbi:hypothetical protein Lser_V15G33315 [Lactuca serriola]
MADSSIPPCPPHALAQTQEDLKYLYASNTNVSNFVSVKLSSDRNYHLWETQMFCLLETYNLHGIVDATFIHPRTLNPEIEKQYNSLVKGWIFGSISEELLGTVVDLGSAKEVWEKLKSFYDPVLIISHQAKDIDRVPTERETEEADIVSAETEAQNKDRVPTETTKDIDMDSLETETDDKDNVPIETKIEEKETLRTETKPQDDIILTDIQIKVEDPKTEGKNKITRNKELLKAIVQGRWWEVESTLKEDKAAATEAINSDGNTVLHIAVGIGRNFLVSEILSLIKHGKLLKMINLDGSTALHIAAIVGNTEAAMTLIKNDRRLLEIPDHKGEIPLEKAYENMHLDTIEYLLKAMDDDGKPKKQSSTLEDSVNPGVKVGVNLLVNAVSAKQYDLATKLVKKFPKFAVENDNVLLAIAKTFPMGLDYWETLIYPIKDDIFERIVRRSWKFVEILEDYYEAVTELIHDIPDDIILIIPLVLLFIFGGPVLMFISIYRFIRLLILIVYFPLFMFYFLLWNVATKVVAPIKHIHKKKKEWEEGKEVLKLVCDEIDKSEFPDAHPRYYTNPILEAARQNAYEVVAEILMRSPEAIRYKDKSGYDIIQLAVIHRSEKIYNLIDILGERRSVYRMIEDSSKNNMLHLVGRLAPSHKLKLRTGAALQLQRELQWREEVQKLVFPSYITRENIFMETPDMVFTKEHANLVKEGEKWMKAVAESCSITAALITTIVFAAAITVPGGNDQTIGTPLFTGKIPFAVFALSDAISLFASSTSLLMFLSILTGRFSEQDFLVSLPRRLIIGLCTLMLSTTTMMVAFGATLYLVFCHGEAWNIALICVLASVPVASFGTLQIPLIVDLFRSTYVRTFGKPSNHNNIRFNPDHIRLFFGK